METLSENTFLFHTDIGLVVMKVREVTKYDVEDFIRDRALSLGRKLQCYLAARGTDVNAPKGARTVSSFFTQFGEDPLP